MKKLFEYAAEINVDVEFRDDLDPHHPGTYCDRTRTIQLLDGMGYVKTRSALAHELGHATLRHSATNLAFIHARNERDADLWAATFLIDNGHYRDAEARYGTRTDWIAQDLCVLRRLVDAYESSLVRLGCNVYVSPKMGSRQWLHKMEAS